MNDTWDLSVLYTDFDTPEFQTDTEKLQNLIDRMNALAASCADMEHKALLLSYFSLKEELAAVSGKMLIYASLRTSANTDDTAASGMYGNLMNRLSAVTAAETRLSRMISEMDDTDAILSETPELSEYGYYIRKLKENAEYLLSDKEEALFAKLKISGSAAWEDLQSALTSTVKADYRGNKITLSEVRNLAYDPDPKVRRDAYDAELACYPQIRDSVAFSLNSIKLQVISECELRGFSSPLAKALNDSCMKRETLDALLAAMDEYLPHFHKYLRAKAKLLGYENGLPFYELFAPIGKSDKKYSTQDAKDYLLSVFGKFDRELHDMVKTAFENRWIDFYPREGKVGGAFDCGVPAVGQSRVLTNFDGAFGDVVTLAHELGHAFHDRQVFAHSQVNQDYSMPVAETASTFNEVLVVSTAIGEAQSREEKLALIENQLQDACQIICDIYSRYLFESAVFENRTKEFMNADKFCALMLEAQRKAYGDGLDSEYLHPYMWLCKSHYYSGNLSFYNFPYAFGGLFARGLYALYQKEGEAFVPQYKKMLYATSVCDVEECAKIVGIDLTDKAFWEAGLQSLADEIDEFCTLAQSN